MKSSRLARQVSLAALLLSGAWPLLSQATPPAAPASPSAPASPAAPAPTSPDSQQQSQAKPDPAKKPDTAAENPFPEDISRSAAVASGNDASPADKPPISGAPGKSPADVPPTSSSSSRSKFEGLGDLSDGSDRISNGAGGYIVNPKLAAEDVHVGGLYLEEHDYKGAYLRYKEATRVDPENVDAVFGLAEAARGLRKNDEAVQNYVVYLDASPDGKKAKEARKALASLGGAPKK